VDGRAEVSLVRLSRLSDAPPPARELLDVDDDGSVAGWLSQGPAIGRFAGSVPDITGLRGLVDAAAGTDPPSTATFPHDATIDRLRVAGDELVTSDKTTPDGAWGELLAATRALLDGLVGSPAAAIALEVAGPGLVRLVHRGSDVLPIRLETLTIDVTRWRDDNPVGSKELSGLGLGRVEAGPGWSQDLPIDGGPEGEPGDLLTAVAWFVAEDDGVYVPVLVTGRGTAS
jgi:hypothetical protein